MQSQKSTFSQMLQALESNLVTRDYLQSVSDVSQMPRVLATYYLGQADPQMLDCRDADLLMIDNYAEMNFSMWVPNQGGSKFWMHPKYLRDQELFFATHCELGRSSFRDSLNDAAQLIENLRQRAPGLPVLVLNQQVDYYPKLGARAQDFRNFGTELARQVPLVFAAPVLQKDELELADLNSSGPGNTLHFQAETYLKMLQGAERLGLGEAIVSRRRIKANSISEGPEGGLLASSSEAANEEFRAGEGSATKVAADLQSLQAVGEINLDLDFHPEAFCVEACQRILGGVEKTFSNYFVLGQDESETTKPRFTPMLMQLSDFDGVKEWIAGRPATYRHQIKKAEAAAYFVQAFHLKNHTVDAYEINTSKEVRSGGEIRANLTKSIEDLGGVPQTELAVPKLKCLRHWRQTFGVFEHRAGYMQGGIQTDKKLIAYLSAVRYGDIVVFAQLLGHGDYLDKGVVNFLIQEFIAGAMTEPWGKLSGLKYVMYGGAQNGGQGLFDFKRRSGLSPFVVNLVTQPGFPLGESAQI